MGSSPSLRSRLNKITIIALMIKFDRNLPTKELEKKRADLVAALQTQGYDISLDKDYIIVKPKEGVDDE